MAKETKEIRQFLRERGLVKSFNTFKKIRSKPKKIIEVLQPNYDKTFRRTKVYVLKEKGRTVFRDFNTLNKLGSSKKTIPKAIKEVLTMKDVKKDFKLKGWNIQIRTQISKKQLKNTNKRKSYNKTLKRLRTIMTTNRALRSKFGFAVIDATYVAPNGTRVRVQARSKGGINLSRKRQKEDAIQDAIHNGSAVAGFSPVDIIVHDFWFEYWTDEQIDLNINK